MRLGKIGSNLFASDFDAILTSTLINEIGRQFFKKSFIFIFLLE